MTGGRLLAAASLLLVAVPAPAPPQPAPSRKLLGAARVRCAEAAIDVFPTAETTPAYAGMRVGVRFLRGQGLYHVDDASVTVEWGGRDGVVLAARASDFPASDRTLALTFDGVDADGRRLPPGRYPVVVEVGSHAVGRCPGGSAGLRTVATTLDWRG